MAYDIVICLAVAYGILIGVIHLFGGALRPPQSQARVRIVWFAAGVLIARLFLALLSRTHEAGTLLRQWVLVFLLIGFSIIRLSEKWMYQHHAGVMQDRELTAAHSTAFFAYDFVVGIALVAGSGT